MFVLLVLTGCDRVITFDKNSDAMPIDARTGYAGAVLADAPVAYWRLGTGMTAFDETGNGNVGTFNGGVMPGAPGALVSEDDGATTFDGMNDTITMGNRLAFPGNDPFTVEAWVNPADHKVNYGGVVTKADETQGGSVKEGYLMYDHFDTFGFDRIRADGNGQTVRTPGPLAKNTWTYVVATYDGATLVLYADGVMQDSESNPVSLGATAKPFTLGARNGGEFLFFEGRIDEVAIYDKALTVDQIDKHRRAALGI